MEHEEVPRRGERRALEQDPANQEPSQPPEARRRLRLEQRDRVMVEDMAVVQPPLDGAANLPSGGQPEGGGPLDPPPPPPGGAPPPLAEAGTDGIVIATRPTHRRLARGQHANWRAACAPAFRQYILASLADDDEAKVAAISTILRLPSKILPSVRGGARRSRPQLARQLSRAVQELAEEPDDLDAADFEERIQEPLQEGPRQDDQSPEAILERQVRRAAHLAGFGHIGKAAQALVSKPPVLPSPAVVKELEELHKARPQSGAALPQPPEGPAIIVDTAQLKKVIGRYAQKGPGHGPSGWTAELLAPLTGDEQTLQAMCTLTEDILNGVLPAAAHKLLTAAREIDPVCKAQRRTQAGKSM